MLKLILIALIAKSLAAGPPSQGHIKYSDSNGSKVDWKLYAPYAQYKSQLRQNQRRDDSKFTGAQSQIIRPLQSAAARPASEKSVDPEYKPFSQVPNHLKQLLLQSYEPPIPHVDPDAFFHRIPGYADQQVPQFSSEQSIPQQSEPMELYRSKVQSTIVKSQNQGKRKENFPTEEEEAQQQAKNESPVSPVSLPFIFDKSVPLQIQQLLRYQAQIPYNVIANHIIYKPKVPFVPEPIPEGEFGPYNYRSRIYYPVDRIPNTDKKQRKGETENHDQE
ncbi:uncharacterized protein LOC105692133 [Athalia rosae]|uniref:uncharacterized protein LOC105692133 n=1 Tax=Athalia rosae TaxID=37344 RepID=UPI0020332DE5|nr:uncharacterized protein LOC105692133 [Athalia rosae]XP_048513617.1 uncharacterized protein LOC105692133 [Athalia rosae]XP_048513618.1 uncharacterized protein LOC105692133 [Athalia rosae]